jgi:hypothetical protein
MGTSRFLWTLKHIATQREYISHRRPTGTDAQSLIRLISWTMPSILDFPPELILTILHHLRGPNEPSRLSQSIRKRPQVADGAARSCPCSDSEKVIEQFLTIAGRYSGQYDADRRRDAVTFGITHPYFMDCIDESGLCEMVDAWATESGLLWPHTTTIPSAVRQVEHNCHEGPDADICLCVFSKGCQRDFHPKPNDCR